jgi:hypothetical protein
MKFAPRWSAAFCALVMSALPACSASSDPDTGSNGGAGGSTSGAGGGGAATGSGASAGFQGTGGLVATGGVTSSGGDTGSGGVPSTGGAAGAAGMIGTGGAAPVRVPECITKSSQVILMGDSYINWVSHTFPADLYAAAGQTFRSYAIGAYSMGSGGIGFIPTQFDTAVAEDPDIKVIVLSGGGNDILVPDTAQFPQGGSCKNDPNAPNIPDCQAIVQKAIDAALALMGRVIAQGVTDVVYFFYPHVPEGTLVGGLYPNAILDYALPRVKAACDGAEAMTDGQLRCHFVDLVPVFAGHPEWFAPADIHPNMAGSQVMAQAVWQKMTDVCVGQTSANGCCEVP